MTTLGKALKKATGLLSAKKSTAVYTTTTTTPNSSEVVYRFDNKLFTNEVESVNIKAATVKKVARVSDLPGSDATADL